MEKIIYTIGHSTRTVDEFLRLLKEYGIETVADIRSYPSSRHSPQFNQSDMKRWAPGYVHLPKLGGRRKASGIDPALICGWTHQSFKNYAAYMQTDEFLEGIEELEGLAQRSRTAYMCSEALWWKCHRRMVSDALVFRGWTVEHIMDNGLTPHIVTEFAQYDGKFVTYPPTV